MPLYHVTLRREVTAVDEFDDYIDAASPEEAARIAERIGARANDDCPDHATEVEHQYCGSWALHNIAPAPQLAPGYEAVTAAVLDEKA